MCKCHLAREVRRNNVWIVLQQCVFHGYCETHHDMKVAAHLQHTLQSLHHLLSAECAELAVTEGFVAFHLTDGGLQSNGSTLYHTHPCRNTEGCRIMVLLSITAISCRQKQEVQLSGFYSLWLKFCCVLFSRALLFTLICVKDENRKPCSILVDDSWLVSHG